MAPHREDLVVAVACLFPWYGRADLCTHAGIPFVLCPALDMKAIPGGKAKHEPIDAHQLAVLLRGGMLPQASVCPAERRATRAFLRRRMPRMRPRAEWLAHSHNTHRPYNLPAIGHKRADKAHREGVATRFPEPAVQQRINLDRTLIDASDRLLTDLERARVRRYALPDIRRFPRVQAGVSSGRLVTCAKASAGTRAGTSGQTIGQAYRTWAFSAAAVLGLRHHPAGQPSRAHLTNTQGKGQALTVLAPT